MLLCKPIIIPKEIYKTGICLPSFSLSLFEYDLITIIDIIAASNEYKKMSKLFQTNAGINNPLIVKNITPNIGSASSGSGRALNAAKYQKNICNSNGMFLKNST